MDSIKINFDTVQTRIFSAAERANREVDAIGVVAISKSQPAGAVREAYELGLRDFGENRVQEGVEKQAELEDLTDIRWHMVGHIQSRKAGDVPAHFQMVHSVDRVKIAHHLNKHAADLGIVLPIMLECNVSGEQSKYGWELSARDKWGSVVDEFKPILGLEQLEVRGLMTMAPWVEDEQVIRTTFQTLRNLRDYLEEALEVRWPELSMGMSDDFEIAVEEGATLLRIGRAIFGPRQD